MARRAVEHHAVPSFAHEREGFGVLPSFGGVERATGGVEVLLDGRGVGPRDERQPQRWRDRDAFADLDRASRTVAADR